MSKLNNHNILYNYSTSKGKNEINFAYVNNRKRIKMALKCQTTQKESGIESHINESKYESQYLFSMINFNISPSL